MIPGNIWFILKLLGLLAFCALLFGFLGWWLRGFFISEHAKSTAAGTPTSSDHGARDKERERVKKLEASLQKAESAYQSLKGEHETLQKSSASRQALEQLQNEHAALKQASEASQRQVATLEADLKRTQATAATLNAKVNEAGKAQSGAALALQNDLAKTKEELARALAEGATTAGLKTEIEQLRENLAIANRANSQLRKSEATATAALAACEARLTAGSPASDAQSASLKHLLQASSLAPTPSTSTDEHRQAAENAAAENAAKRAAEKAAAEKAAAEQATKLAAEKAAAEQAAKETAQKAAAEHAAKLAAERAAAEHAAKEAAEKAAAELAAKEASEKAAAELAAKEASEKAAAELAAKLAAEKAAAEKAAAVASMATPPGELPLFAAAPDSNPLPSAAAGVPSAGAKNAEASEAFGKRVGQDDLQIVEGIGPKIKELLHGGGITTWAGLADATVEQLQAILHSAGEAFAVHNPGTWPRQAALARDGKWAELKTWQDVLDGGKE